MGLTKHQEDVVEKGLAILEIGNRLNIEGSAGVGKTFLADALIRKLMLKRNNMKVIVSAPTNKAVEVIRKKITIAGSLVFSTTHSALKMKRNINFRDGSVTFKPSFSEKFPPLKGINLLIIDEASMIPTEMLYYLEEHAQKNNTTIIFLGDNKQLNPVGEEGSPVFLGKPFYFNSEVEANMLLAKDPEGTTVMEHPTENKFVLHKKYPTVVLTEIVRQGEGNPIIKLSRNLDLVKDKTNAYTEGGFGYIHTNDIGEIVTNLATANGTDALKYLAWTNKEVDRVNIAVRKAIYGETPKKIEKGETLVFNTQYKDFFTNQEIKVKTVVEEKVSFFYPSNTGKRRIQLLCYRINPTHNSSEDRYEDGVVVIHEKEEKSLQDLTLSIKNNCKAHSVSWKDYYEFLGEFADLKYNHAITIHKS